MTMTRCLRFEAPTAPRLACLGVVALLTALFLATPAAAQPTTAPTPVRTDSPRDTFETFQRLSAAMEVALAEYLAAPSFSGAARLGLLTDQMNALIDLQEIADASQREVGSRTISFLLDIFGRIDPIDAAVFPDVDGVAAEDVAQFRIPQTSLYILQQAEGERRGEFLFSAATVDIAPRLFRAVRGLPLRSVLPIDSFSALSPQLTGPLVSPAVLEAIPQPLRRLWLGTPIWKVLVIVAAFAALAFLLLLVQRVMGAGRSGGRLGGLLLAALSPLALLTAVELILPSLAFQLNPSGDFAAVVSGAGTVIAHAAYGWLYWIVVRIVFETIILSPNIGDRSLDANLLRLIGSVFGIVGVVVILAFGGQAIGLPILSVLAGLGIGGLAVALALRPTLENLVGGVMLYIDRPVRVGDFCRFGDQMGSVEVIGVRSTKLRALDRTLISVPNAQFADMQIVNFAHCDQMLIHEVLGMRYETSPDQLRHLLAGLRRMLHGHPRIDASTVRVRFAGYGDYALKVDMRVYAVTREWNDFFAIREDVFLRVADVVAASGTGFAFPSQTLYLNRDDGLDAKRGDAAENAVAGWRRSGSLPFPRMSQQEADALRDTLDYPPRGSVDHGQSGMDDSAAAEPLSGGDEAAHEEATPAADRRT